MKRPPIRVILRWVVAGWIALAGLRILIGVMAHGGDMMEVFGKSLYGLAMLITACLFVAPEIVHWTVYPIHRVLDSILLPSESLRPPVDYTLALFYHRQMRYEEACEEYFKILGYHPQEVPAYLGGIEAATASNQRATAMKFYRMGMRRLSAKNGDRDRLLKGIEEGPAILLGGDEPVEPI